MDLPINVSNKKIRDSLKLSIIKEASLKEGESDDP
jgi:hypothetical protein